MSAPSIFILILSLGLSFSPRCLYADEESSSAENRQPTKLTTCDKAYTLLAGIGSLTTIAVGIAVLQDDRFHAWREGKTAVGFGILLDMKTVEEKLDNSERALLSHPQVNALAIAKMLSKKLSGDYDHRISDEQWRFEHYRYRDAADFLKDGTQKKGVCRHKAAILHAILDRLGIPNRLVHGAVNSSNDDSLHAWVELTDLDIVADPTSGTVDSVENYYKANGVSAPDVKEFYPRMSIEPYSQNPNSN